MPSRTPPNIASLRICLLTCLWGRHALSKLMLDYYARLADEMLDLFDLQLMAVGSEGRVTERLVRDRGFWYLEHPNAPLGRKWNAGLRDLRSHAPDVVVTVGSDDFISREGLLLLWSQVHAQILYGGWRDMFFLDLESRRSCYWPGYDLTAARAGEPVGAGRFYSAQLLDTLDWNLWLDSLERGLDGVAHQRVQAHLSADVLLNACAIDRRGCILGVKTSQNLWSYARLARAGRTHRTTITRSILDDLFTPQEREALWKCTDVLEKSASRK